MAQAQTAEKQLVKTEGKQQHTVKRVITGDFTGKASVRLSLTGGWESD